MHYVESGKGDGTKPLMVFLHGFPEFWFSWRYQLKHFSRDFWYIPLLLLLHELKLLLYLSLVD